MKKSIWIEWIEWGLLALIALFVAGVVIMRAEITSPDNSSTAPIENLLE
jgi:hypothetical protein